MKTVYNVATGKAITIESVDAKEYVATGRWSFEPKKEESKPEPKKEEAPAAPQTPKESAAQPAVAPAAPQEQPKAANGAGAAPKK